MQTAHSSLVGFLVLAYKKGTNCIGPLYARNMSHFMNIVIAFKAQVILGSLT